MVKLVHSALMSLGGFIEDKEGSFDGAEPDGEVHTFINGLEARHCTYLYGRSMYEVMAAWENDELISCMPGYMQDFARISRAAEKVVYSAFRERVSTSRTRQESCFSPESVPAMKASAERDITVAGPSLAAHAFQAGLVDECQVFVAPISVTGGKSAMPQGSVVRLALVEQRRFGSGFAYLRYNVKPGPAGAEGQGPCLASSALSCRRGLRDANFHCCATTGIHASPDAIPVGRGLTGAGTECKL